MSRIVNLKLYNIMGSWTVPVTIFYTLNITMLGEWSDKYQIKSTLQSSSKGWRRTSELLEQVLSVRLASRGFICSCLLGGS